MMGSKTEFYLDELVFLKKNFSSRTNMQLLEHINNHRHPDEQIGLTVLRGKLYELGLKRCEKGDPWTDDETRILIDNYKTVGNIEIAEMLNALPKPTRKFNKKNVEKKMILMGLKRTPEDIETLRQRNIEKGCYGPIVGTRGHKVGSKFTWRIGNRKQLMIKVAPGKIERYARHVWEQHNGEIPRGMNIYHKDGNNMNCNIENLFLSKPKMVKYSKHRNRIPQIDGDYLKGGWGAKYEPKRPSLPRAYTTQYAIR